MWGVTTKHFKTGILLFIPTVALALAWQYVPHLWFLTGVPLIALLVALAWLSRDSWRQAAKNDPILERRTVQRSKPARPALSPRPVPRPASPARSRSAAVEVRARTRSSAAEARARRRAELLDEGATVTLSAERQASGVDDVFSKPMSPGELRRRLLAAAPEGKTLPVAS